MSSSGPVITLEEVQKNPTFKTYIEVSNKALAQMGYTEHGFRHASLIGHISLNIMKRLGYSERDCQLAAIAGYLHDIGNLVGRDGHWNAGALLARPELEKMGMSTYDIALVMNAIGNHEEDAGYVTSKICAATILADKSDVHHTRVQNPDITTFDIHDRVNHAARKSFLRVDEEQKIISLEIEIDTAISPIIDYFEIFLSRMVMCRKAAEFLGCDFALIVNENRLA